MTSSKLLRLLVAAGCTPAAEGGTLTLDTAPPRELERQLRLLHTGVLAVLTGRPWVGAGVPKPAVAVLDPTRVIPVGVQILTVAGISLRWDRLHPAARTDSPECFERPASATRH